MANSEPASDRFRGVLTRRTLLGYFPVAAVWSQRRLVQTAGQAPAASSPGTWKPWLLSASDALRPAPPGSVSADDLSEVVASQRQATAASLATIERWDDPTVILPWTTLALDLIKVHHPNPVRAGRALALLQVALFDTLVATEDARAVSPQPGPATDQAVTLLGRTPANPHTFPSAHAAVATAAATVLASLFPDEPATELSALADEAATSRLIAGQAFRRDIEAGQAIGAAVAALAVARGQADGSSATWDGAGRLTGDGSWQPTPPGYFQQPTEPLAGTWRPWILASGDQYRPPAPPAYRSPAWEAELAGVQEAVARRTEEQAQAVRFWAGGPGTVTPAGLWIEIARELIVREASGSAPGRARPGPDQRGHGRWLHLLLGRQVHLLERATHHGGPQSRRADPHATLPLLHLRPLHHLDRGRGGAGPSLSPRRSSAGRTGGRSQELAPLGRDPFPHRQRDGRPRRRHDRPPGGGAGPK